jgi:hypothetical protein
MATLTISLSGSGVINGSKTYTVSDADITSLLQWAVSNYASALPLTPTNSQILLAWVQGWINATINSVKQFQTPPPVTPTPISIS